MLSYYILIIAFMYKLLYSEYVLRILVMGPGVLLSLQDLTHALQVGCAEKITDESTKEKRARQTHLGFGKQGPGLALELLAHIS